MARKTKSKPKKKPVVPVVKFDPLPESISELRKLEMEVGKLVRTLNAAKDPNLKSYLDAQTLRYKEIDDKLNSLIPPYAERLEKWFKKAKRKDLLELHEKYHYSCIDGYKNYELAEFIVSLQRNGCRGYNSLSDKDLKKSAKDILSDEWTFTNLVEDPNI